MNKMGPITKALPWGTLYLIFSTLFDRYCFDGFFYNNIAIFMTIQTFTFLMVTLRFFTIDYLTDKYRP